MKKIFLISCLFSICAFSYELIHPLDFKGTEKEKKNVINFITKNVKDTYSKIGMDDPSTLRLMEKEELNSFKELTQSTNKKLLNSVIKQYCNIGMCNYNTIKLMYNQQNEDSKKKLKW